MAAGQFTESQLLETRLKAEQYWKNGAYQSTYAPEAQAAVAVLENQTMQFEAFNDYATKERKVRVTWLDVCGAEVRDCVSTCELTEPELESKSQVYEPNICKQIGFSIDFTKLKTNDYTSDEVVLKGIASRVKALDEYWARQILAKLATFAGVNVAPAPFTFDPVEITTNVPTADYNIRLLANLIQQAKLNRMSDVYMIDNGALFLELLNAQFNAGNLDGKGDASRLSQFQKMLYDDQFNFAAAGITDDMFVINKGAVAFQTVNKNPDRPTLIGGNVQQTVYTVPSNILKGVKYDVYYTVDCKTVGGKAHYFHTWTFETNGLIELNPESCPVTIGATTYTPTGVLSYTKI